MKQEKVQDLVNQMTLDEKSLNVFNFPLFFLKVQTKMQN